MRPACPPSGAHSVQLIILPFPIPSVATIFRRMLLRIRTIQFQPPSCLVIYTLNCLLFILARSQLLSLCLCRQTSSQMN